MTGSVLEPARAPGREPSRGSGAAGRRRGGSWLAFLAVAALALLPVLHPPHPQGDRRAPVLAAGAAGAQPGAERVGATGCAPCFGAAQARTASPGGPILPPRGTPPLLLRASDSLPGPLPGSLVLRSAPPRAPPA